MVFIPLRKPPARAGIYPTAPAVLPRVLLILGTYLSASTMRMTRTMMLEVLRQDYVRTAWAKSLLERSVILRHAVKNAFIFAPALSLTDCLGCRMMIDAWQCSISVPLPVPSTVRR